MFWWDSDAPHPTRTNAEAQKYYGHIHRLYQRLDRVILVHGKILRLADRRTAGRGVDQLACSVLARRLQHVDRAEDVDRGVTRWVFHRAGHARLGRLVAGDDLGVRRPGARTATALRTRRAAAIRPTLEASRLSTGGMQLALVGFLMTGQIPPFEVIEPRALAGNGRKLNVLGVATRIYT